MNLVYSYHARQRMRRRGITDSDVRSCLRNYHSRIVGGDSIMYIGDVNGRSLKVVTAIDRDSETEKFVITTVWRGDDDS
ncbi:DUF4258 domain-containing protein [Lentzea flava]|uniref:DUF4258 domain-containing protein n=1 Tax=Lentzea flava TaxID=103732 RepID=A0ABQ2UHI9_9PSEU|nr:protein of unknown function (DUF4258) [Lentzea flava]GGU29027.1 hypothetical protein GCM10010178_21450 [Lentzea flava]